MRRMKRALASLTLGAVVLGIGLLSMTAVEAQYRTPTFYLEPSVTAADLFWKQGTNGLYYDGDNVHVGDDSVAPAAATAGGDLFVQGTVEALTLTGYDDPADATDVLTISAVAGEGNATPTNNNRGGSVEIYAGDGSGKTNATNAARGGDLYFQVGAGVSATGTDAGGSAGQIDFWGYGPGGNSVDGNAGGGGKLDITMGAGGNATGTSSGNGGTGGGMDFYLGNGGGATNASGSGNGGRAGTFHIHNSAGGQAAGSGNAGGGSDFVFSGGVGGSANSGTAGDGGSFLVEPGLAGSSTSGTDGRKGVVTFGGTGAGDYFLVVEHRVRSTISNGGTITADEIVGGILYQDASGGNVTMTTPTGTQIEALFPAIVNGYSIRLYVVSNHATNTSTISGGTGVTLVGSGAVTNIGGTFLLIRTAANTFDLLRVG